MGTLRSTVITSILDLWDYVEQGETRAASNHVDLLARRQLPIDRHRQIAIEGLPVHGSNSSQPI
jgi:hypothetical protein